MGDGFATWPGIVSVCLNGCVLLLTQMKDLASQTEGYEVPSAEWPSAEWPSAECQGGFSRNLYTKSTVSVVFFVFARCIYIYKYIFILPGLHIYIYTSSTRTSRGRKFPVYKKNINL